MKRKDEEFKDEWSERFGNFYKNSGGIAIVDQPNTQFNNKYLDTLQ